MGDLREMLFAIEITLVGITAAVLSVLYNSFLGSVVSVHGGGFYGYRTL